MRRRTTLWGLARTGGLLLLHILVFSPALYAANHRLNFHHLIVQDGLPHNCVYAILQDSKGFMWFGTYVGLARYDGYTITVYKHDPDDPHSLSHNAVLALHEDSRGNLWIGTIEGLNQFDRQTEQFIRYTHDPDTPHSLSGNKVCAILEDRAGHLWIGTGAGLNRLNYDTGQFIHYSHNPENPFSLSHNDLFWLSEDHLGNLWVGTTAGGLNRFDPTTEHFIRYQHDPDDPTSLSHDAINAIYEDTSGQLWVGTMDGLNRFDRVTGQFTRYRHEPDNPFSLSDNLALRIAEDHAGRLWIGTNNGLNRFDEQTGRFIRYNVDPMDRRSLSDDRIRALYTDRSGVLWIGTKTGGVNRFDRTSEYFPHYAHNPADPHSLSSNEVYPIAEDHAGILWIGTRGGGLNRFDRTTGTFRHYRHNADDPRSLSWDIVRSIYEDRSGRLWIGTNDGVLHQFHRSTGTFDRYYPHPPAAPGGERSVEVIYEARDGTFWIGTREGLCRFDRETGQFHCYQHDPDNPDSLSDNWVRQLYEDAAGILWIGTENGGLNCFDRANEQFTPYQHDSGNPQSLSHNGVLAIHEDRQGRFWIGTYLGLNQFDRDSGTMTRYREKDGLPDDTIRGILEDSEGNLWLSTNLGISKFNPDDDDKPFKNYNLNDGLQGNEFNLSAFCQTQDGLMLFGGMNGFNMFDPGQITENPYSPPVVITDFQLFNNPVPIGDDSVLQQPIGETDSLTLSHNDFIFSFEFVALNYTVPEKNQYAYRLEKFEQEWNYVDSCRRFATYTHVPAGKYVFRVKASNNDGIWNEEGTSIAITILPPWWETWWFRTAVLLLVGVGLFMGHHMRIRAVRVREKQLERQVDARTQELKQEIEERKRTERALRESEARFRSIVDTAPGMLHVTDPHGKVLYVSPNCKEMTGYTQEELMTALHWWVHQDNTPEARELYDRTFSLGIGWRNFEYKALKKSGEIWYASSSWEPVKDEDGNFAGIVMQTVDVTERKQAEKQLQRLYQQARQDAAIKADLLREINHRVRNNLMSIAGMLSLEQKHLAERDQAAYYDVMYKMTNRINGFARVHELLSASKWEPVLLEALIQKVVHSSLQALPPDQDVTVDISPSPLRVNAEQAHHLALITNELTTNVLKHALQERMSARISVRITSEENLASVTFRDDGPGYPDEALRQAQYHVGLELVQQLVQRGLGGSWSLRNDDGAVIEFQFPVETP